jgi:LysR family transcriptional activator of nhaA
MIRKKSVIEPSFFVISEHRLPRKEAEVRHLNLKHLRYFWTVASEGSIARAADILHVTPQTISGQLRLLEEDIGAKLFEKAGRGLAPSETGRVVFSYADEIFRLSDELRDVLSGRPSEQELVLRVGIAMVVPKLLAYRVLEPAFNLPEPVRLICQEAPLVDLLAELSVHKLDLVLADSPVSPVLNIKAYNHVLGESGISFFAAPKLARKVGDNFPAAIDGLPMLMPASSSALRRALEQWLQHQEIQPVVAAEFEDRALMKAFGEAGRGIFTIPTTMEEDVSTKYGVEVIGRTDQVRERYYAISTERRIRHPAVAAITEAARSDLFV